MHKNRIQKVISSAKSLYILYNDVTTILEDMDHESIRSQGNSLAEFGDNFLCGLIREDNIFHDLLNMEDTGDLKSSSICLSSSITLFLFPFEYSFFFTYLHIYSGEEVILERRIKEVT